MKQMSNNEMRVVFVGIAGGGSTAGEYLVPTERAAVVAVQPGADTIGVKTVVASG